jgi:hypothetical protein
MIAPWQIATARSSTMKPLHSQAEILGLASTHSQKTGLVVKLNVAQGALL